MIKHILIIILVFFSINLLAQNYERALGIRVGLTSGVEYKKFINYDTAIEGLISFQRGGTQFTYLRVYHHPIMLFMEGTVLFYYGFGGHFGYTRWSNKKYYINGYTYRRRVTAFNLGIDANIGVEYQFPDNPFVLSFDYKPYYEVSMPQDFNTNNYDFAISLKYSF